MKKFLLGTVGLVALGMAAPAVAADMAVKAAPVPYIAPMYNWSGFYIGANGGWGQRDAWLRGGSPLGKGGSSVSLRLRLPEPLSRLGVCLI